MRRARCVACGSRGLAAVAIASCGAAPRPRPRPTSTSRRCRCRTGDPSIGTPVNITHRPGYDNQPSFTPDSRAILFTSTHEDAQSDIYRYDIASKQITRVTQDARERILGDGDARRQTVLGDSRREGLDAAAVELRARRIRSESRHRNAQARWLSRLDRREQPRAVRARPPQRARPHRRPDRESPIRSRAASDARCCRCPTGAASRSFDRPTRRRRVVAATWPGFATRDLVALPRGSQDVAWVSNDVLIVGSGLARSCSGPRAPRAGRHSAISAAQGLRAITRIAVSPDGKWIAIVPRECREAATRTRRYPTTSMRAMTSPSSTPSTTSIPSTTSPNTV